MNVKLINFRIMGILGLRKSLVGRDRGFNVSDYGVVMGRWFVVVSKKRESRGLDLV